MSHLSEFPEISIPSPIAKAYSSALIEDTSHGLDATASFICKGDESDTRLWIYHEDPAQREYPDQPRINVCTSDGKLIYLGDNAEEALAALLYPVAIIDPLLPACNLPLV